MFGLAFCYHRFFHQRRRRARVDAGTAGDAFRIHEVFALSGRNARFETAAGNGQRKRSLLFLAGAHAAVAHDALGRVEGEVRIGFILLHIGKVVGSRHAVAHFAQSYRAGHGLQFAVAVGRAGQAIERMVGDVQLHHIAPQVGEPGRLRAHFHAGFGRRRARRRVTAPSFDLDQTQAAGAERFERICRAQFWDHDSGLDCGAHDRGAGGHAHSDAVYVQSDFAVGDNRGSTVIEVVHWKSSGK